MSIPVLIIGKSGSGKSASLRNLAPANTQIVSVLGKPLPFRSKLPQAKCEDAAKIAKAVAAGKKEIYVIDDAGYLMTNMFMRSHSAGGGGNSVFTLYNNIGDSFWRMVSDLAALPDNKRIYILMHEDKSEAGDVKPKSIGKMIDEKVCLEGMFTICLRCMMLDGKHVFRTQSDGLDVAKSPMGMFDSIEIDNDLKLVDDKICEYYEIERSSER